MKTYLLAAAALLFATAAQSAELAFPSDAPVATITFPDTWKPQETETGIDVTSPADAIYLAVDVTDGAGAGDAAKDAVEYFKSKGVTVDGATAQETAGTLNGMDYRTITWQGTDADSPVTISLGMATISAEKVLLLSYWGTKGAQDAETPELVAILNSLKPAAE